MNFIPTMISGVFLMEPRLFGGLTRLFYGNLPGPGLCCSRDRGGFTCRTMVPEGGKGYFTRAGYQIQQAQGKLFRVVAGEVFDVVVDLRRSSPDCGKWAGFDLSAENKRQVWVPPGFAHGFTC